MYILADSPLHHSTTALQPTGPLWLCPAPLMWAPGSTTRPPPPATRRSPPTDPPVPRSSSERATALAPTPTSSTSRSPHLGTLQQ